MAEKVRLVEMSPRDGLQNEPSLIPSARKIALVDLLSAVGFDEIEVTSFVSPKWVPQMADAAEVMAGITRAPGVRYTALTPNLAGYHRARAAGVEAIAIFASASEGFSQHNINCSIAESFERFAPILAEAMAAGIPVRGYVSCVTDCPYDGPTAPQQVANVISRLLDAGCHKVSLGDTIGAATPETTARMLEAVLATVPPSCFAGHFHDTHGRALENISTSLDHGLRVFDASVAGLGGCPYAPGAKGNVDTVAVAELMEARGFDTGLDRTHLMKAATFAADLRAGA